MAFQTLLTLFTLSALTTAQTPWTTGQTVPTTSGPVRGHAAFPNANVSEYLGIPFAQPPLGPLRFAPPAPITTPSTTPINGTNFGFSCLGAQIYPLAANATGLTPQGREIYNEWNQVGDRFSEDCLTLNVWTKPQVGEARKAVLVWLYGGGFFTGGTSVPLYNGRVFADEQDVVVVSVNYRLNMFGFPGSPATPQNLGLLDMRAAINWVSQNIANFGGDPTRIVVFGQSAGAVAADMLIYAFPQTDTPIKGLILQSGTAAAFSGLGQMNTTGAAALWNRAAAQVGCVGDNNAVLACMRAKPAADLLRVQFPPAAPGAMATTPFGGFLPTVDNVTVFGDYLTRTNFSRVPILLGNNDNEGGITTALVQANTGVANPNPNTNTTAPAAAATDAIFTCPDAQRAAIAVANTLPVWRYRWFGSFPNTQLLTNVNSGAWHGSELGVLFGTNQVVVPDTAGERALGTFLRGMWAAFARDPAAGLSAYGGGVPRYVAGGQTLVRLGFNGSVGLNLATGNSFDGGCGQLGAANVAGMQVGAGEKVRSVGWGVLGLVGLMSGVVLGIM